MNWDRVNRENRAWREARRAPSGSWEPDHNWEAYDPPKVDRRPRVEAKRRRSKTGDKAPTVPWGMGTSKAARQRRRRRERAERASAGAGAVGGRRDVCLLQHSQVAELAG